MTKRRSNDDHGMISSKRKKNEFACNEKRELLPHEKNNPFLMEYVDPLETNNSTDKLDDEEWTNAELEPSMQAVTQAKSTQGQEGTPQRK